eukprot:1157246-Pelagomonas_calceolata.AAC.2
MEYTSLLLVKLNTSPAPSNVPRSAFAVLPVTFAEGKKRIQLSGKWNSHCDMVKCDFEGVPLPDMEPQRCVALRAMGNARNE